MPKRHVQLGFIVLGLAAYLLNATALAWSLVRCEEPDGRIVLESITDHGCCASAPADPHQQGDDAGSKAPSCVSCACPCQDTPLGVQLLTFREQDAPMERPGPAPASFAPPASQTACSAGVHTGPEIRWTPTAGPSAHLPALRTVVLLV